MRLRTTVILTVLPIPILALSLLVGRYPLNLFTGIDSTSGFILFNIRLPRIILCALSGAALSVAGASLQSTLRNPLVSPYILGLSQGAAFGAALAMAIIPYSAYIAYLTPVSAFIFGLIAVSMTCLLARAKGGFSTVTVILAGVIVAAIFTALLSVVRLIADPYRLAGIVFWMLGGYYKASWSNLAIAFPGSVLGLTSLLAVRWRINVLSMGDEEAEMLGVNVQRERLLVVLSSTVACASVISVSGIVGWVGLIIPHMARGLVGSDNRFLIPSSMGLGASILMLTDDICRTLFPFEIPITIVTTLVAAPYFVYLLKKTGAGWR